MFGMVEMNIYDVQMGLAVHVKAPNGKYIVIDLGAGEEDNYSTLKKRIFDKVGCMVITHPHLDHISDIKNLKYADPGTLYCVRSISADVIMARATPETKHIFQQYVNVCGEYVPPVSVGHPDDPEVPSNYGGLKMAFFCDDTCDISNFNNFSIITVFEFEGIKVVVCGDNEVESLEKLMRQSEFREAISKAYVLVAPHHGRKSSYYKDFMACVNPYLTIISDGKYWDSSAVKEYSDASRGWTVYDGCGNKKERYCLTTRQDGNIKILFGSNSLDGRFLMVEHGK